MLIELTKKGKLYKEGNYQKLEIEYVRDGKKQTKKLVAINDTKEVVRKLVQDFNEGDSIEVTLVKSDDDKYWNWTDVSPVEARAAKTSTTVGKGTWETPEERAKRQVYIVRQSSIANALEFHKNNAKVTVEDVLKTATRFTDFVFGDFEEELVIEEKPAKASAKAAADADFQEDIPF